MKPAVAFFKKYRWAVFSGIIAGTSYIPFPPWALFFCWVPVWLDLLTNTTSPREAFYKGWWTQFVFTLIGFHWIAYVAHEFGFLPWGIAVPILLLYAALVHLYFPLTAALTVFLRNRFGLSAGTSFVLMAALYSLGESYWPSVFVWNLGYPLLWIDSPWAQWADVIGFLGLSFLVHLANALVAWLWLRKDRKSIVIAACTVVVFLLITAHFGIERRKIWENPESSVKTLMVQANIGNLEKYYAERGSGFQREIIAKYRNLTEEGLNRYPQTELVIWPESAIPEFLDDHNRQRRFSPLVFEGLKALDRPLLTGAYSNDPPGTQWRNDYNALFLLSPEPQSAALTYHKTQLLMFGEFVPFGEIFPILRKWNPGGEGFGRGSGPTIFPWKDWKIGPQICYESLDPHFSRQLSLQGADFLVNVTNDSWFGPVSEPQQHLFMTLARAIEVRRPLLRSTNTGITTAIEASGRLHVQSPLQAEWTELLDVKVHKNAPLTFYTRYGALLPLVLWLVVGLILGRALYGTSRLARDPQANPKLRDQRHRPSGAANPRATKKP